jgi:hypothetical protein
LYTTFPTGLPYLTPIAISGGNFDLIAPYFMGLLSAKINKPLLFTKCREEGVLFKR